MILSLAWKNIWRKPVRSFIVIISVILGLWVTVFLFGYVFGIINQRFKDAINHEISHIQIHHKNFKDDYDAQYVIDNAENVTSSLKSNPAISAYTTRSIGHGMIASANNSLGGKFIGVQADLEDKLTDISTSIAEGTWLSNKDKNKIVIGQKLAEKLKVRLRSKVVLTFTDKDQNIVSAAFKIVGIFTSSNSLVEESISYVPQADLNRLMSIDDDIHEIAVLLESRDDVAHSVTNIKEAHPQYLTESWKEISPELSLMIDSLDEYMIIFLIIILLALCFGIINTMLMSVLERIRELGMLMAIGMNKWKIFFMIIIETIMIIGLAAPIGMFLAYLTITYFQSKGIVISDIYNEAYAQFGMRSIIYPELSGAYYLRILIVVSIAALLSSIYPAWTAIKLDPISAIRKI